MKKKEDVRIEFLLIQPARSGMGVGYKNLSALIEKYKLKMDEIPLTDCSPPWSYEIEEEE